MPIIICPECDNEVSSKAPTCPKCGAPIAGMLEAEAAGVPLTTIQETSKRFKLHVAISFIILTISVSWLFITFSPIAATFSAIAFTWLVIAKIRIWWHHG